jgi:hypothetical protein
VIAIIALLMAMLTPALRKAKQQTKNAICQAHLRGLGLGLILYLGDNDERFYMPKAGIWGSNQIMWHNDDGNRRNYSAAPVPNSRTGFTSRRKTLKSPVTAKIVICAI